MSRVWMRSIILIFISFSFGFVIGTIPVQRNVFPAYSQWVSNQKAASDSLQTGQSARSQTAEDPLTLPEPGTLEEKQMVERFTFYPLHFLEKTLEAKRKLIEDTQVRSFFSLPKEGSIDSNGYTPDSRKWINKLHSSSFDARVFKAKGTILMGQNHFTMAAFFTFQLKDGKYCWNLSGLFDLVEQKQRFHRESCANLSDFGKFQEDPYALVPISEKGVRDWISYLALPVPVLVEQPGKFLSLESDTGLWKEETLLEWSVADPVEKDRFEASGTMPQ